MKPTPFSPTATNRLYKLLALAGLFTIVLYTTSTSTAAEHKAQYDAHQPTTPSTTTTHSNRPTMPSPHQPTSNKTTTTLPPNLLALKNSLTLTARLSNLPPDYFPLRYDQTGILLGGQDRYAPLPRPIQHRLTQSFERALADLPASAAAYTPFFFMKPDGTAYILAYQDDHGRNNLIDYRFLHGTYVKTGEQHDLPAYAAPAQS